MTISESAQRFQECGVFLIKLYFNQIKQIIVWQTDSDCDQYYYTYDSFISHGGHKKTPIIMNNENYG